MSSSDEATMDPSVTSAASTSTTATDDVEMTSNNQVKSEADLEAETRTETSAAADESSSSTAVMEDEPSTSTSTSTSTPAIKTELTTSLTSTSSSTSIKLEPVDTTMKSETSTSTLSSSAVFDADGETDVDVGVIPSNKFARTTSRGNGNNTPNRRKQSGTDYTQFFEHDTFDDEEDEDGDIEKESAGRQLELNAAVACGLPAFDMTELEQKVLPEFVKHVRFYVDIRNIICTKWQLNVTRYLPVKEAVSDIQTRYRGIAERIYGFLDQYGFINVGLLKPTNRLPYNPSKPKKIIVIGAGAAGLGAARQLMSFGHEVIVLEGRDRVGGRACTDQTHFSGPVDLGASIITGFGGNPVTVLARQLPGCADFDLSRRLDDNPFPNMFHTIKTDVTPIYDMLGQRVDSDRDERVYQEFNRILAATDKLRILAGYKERPDPETVDEDGTNDFPEDYSLLESAETATQYDVRTLDLQTGMKIVCGVLGVQMTPDDVSLINWHMANMEYGNAAPAYKSSLADWDQDDEYGWTGDHCLLRQGYAPFVANLATDVDVRLSHIVTNIHYDEHGVVVTCQHNGKELRFEADLTLCTLPLGVLKQGSVTFTPPLPSWKQDAIDKLGFGLLNKLILEFEYAFWDDVDTIGNLTESEQTRGKFYIFWNLHRSMGRPILVALAAGEAAHSFETEDPPSLVADCMRVLRRIYGETRAVPEPVRSFTTAWSKDPFACGTYSYIAVGTSGKEYDDLARPVSNRLFFAGEATNRNHPATVPGAYLSGVRAAGVIEAVDRIWPNTILGVKLPLDEDEVDVHEISSAKLTRQSASLERSWRKQQAIMKYRRRGMRREYAHAPWKPVVDPAVLEAERQRREAERVAKLAKLETATSALLAGKAINPLASLKVTEQPVVEPKTFVAATEIPTENPFSAQAQNLDGLPVLRAFSDDDHRDKHKSSKKKDKHDKHKSSSSSKDKHHKDKDKHKKKKKRKLEGLSSQPSTSSSSTSSTTPSSSSHKSSSHKDKDRSKKHKHSSSSAGPIRDAISTWVRSLTNSIPASTAIHMKHIKVIVEKTTEKVYQDWISKPRGKIAMLDWLKADKRKIKVTQLLETYVEKAPKGHGNGSHEESKDNASQRYPSSSPSPSPPSLIDTKLISALSSSLSAITQPIPPSVSGPGPDAASYDFLMQALHTTPATQLLTTFMTPTSSGTAASAPAPVPAQPSHIPPPSIPMPSHSDTGKSVHFSSAYSNRHKK